MTTLLWFTHDLRLSDNSALCAASKSGAPILPVYLIDDSNPAKHTGASLWWLHHSLAALNQQLQAQGGELLILRGDTQSLLKLADKHDCQQIYFSRAHEPWLAEQQKQLHQAASRQGVTCKQFAGQLLVEPDTIFNQQDKPFQVFTPYYKTVMNQIGNPTPVTMPKTFTWKPHKIDASKTLKKQQWLPTQPNWATGFNHWRPGETGAHQHLKGVINRLSQYHEARDIPSEEGTSMLSPHLHFGEISPRQVWQTVSQHFSQGEASPYLRQLIWREFSYYLIHHYPHMLNAPFKDKFKDFPWRKATPKKLHLWQQGQTGYPLVDAGMRQLWQTGWMHNRVRMVVASFLTKHLQVHWRKGADWFWDTLLDADLANNTAGWQWVAGCGADAAPYFRIFNPVTQSEKFDKHGDYIRTYVPELAKLPSKYIHAPWEAPEEELKRAGIKLGETYPTPMVDHKTAREEALNAYAAIKN
ncbi:MAG TPA: deoxyribodipyrimidine photo-lyase [Marinagarivorans sp.]